MKIPLSAGTVHVKVVTYLSSATYYSHAERCVSTVEITAPVLAHCVRLRWRVVDDATQDAHELLQIFLVVEVVNACSYLQNKQHNKCGIGEYAVERVSKFSPSSTATWKWAISAIT